MSNGEVRKVSLQDIQLVQNLIERCLQLYMSQREVVSTLLHQAKIEPGFTELVWQKLEAENQDFFRAYHLRLLVKDQILRFNQLLDRQVDLMHQLTQTGVVPIPLSNGSQIHSMHNNSSYQAPQPADHQGIGAMPNVYTNGGSGLQPGIQVVGNMGDQAVGMNMLLAQSSHTGMMHGLNGGTIKTEADYPDSSSIIFGADNNLLEPRNAVGETSVSPLNGGGTSSNQMLNDTIMEQEANSFGFLEQIPRNLSLSDLTADFSNSTDILESYSRSPFLAADPNFWDPHIRGEQLDVRRLDTISEGFSYDDFGSD